MLTPLQRNLSRLTNLITIFVEQIFDNTYTPIAVQRDTFVF